MADMDTDHENGSTSATAEFMDSVNGKDYTKAQFLLEYANIDTAMTMSDLEGFLTVPIPKFKVDVLSSRNKVSPLSVLGCVSVSGCDNLVESMMTLVKPVTICDNDVLIALYHSTPRTVELLVENYPDIVNKRLKATCRSGARMLDEFVPDSLWCYTAVHTLLISCFNLYARSNRYNRTKKYVSSQIRKLSMVEYKGGCLNGHRSYLLPLFGQLLKAGEFALCSYATLAKIVRLNAQDFEYTFRFFLTSGCVEQLGFLLSDKCCDGIDFIDRSPVLNMLGSSMIPAFIHTNIAVLTEFLVTNGFVFPNSNYRIKALDTPSRIYNLYHAGVRLHDPHGYTEEIDTGDILEKEVKKLVEKSKTPFRLETLLIFKIKHNLGPKNLYQKLQSLSSHIPQNLIRTIMTYKATEDCLLEEDSYVMEESCTEHLYHHFVL